MTDIAVVDRDPSNRLAELARQYRADELLAAAACRAAAEVLARSQAGVICDAAVSAIVGAFRLLLLQAIDSAAPHQLSRRSRARMNAMQRQAERQVLS
jgi:hypothetical protein